MNRKIALKKAKENLSLFDKQATISNNIRSEMLKNGLITKAEYEDDLKSQQKKGASYSQE